MCLVTYLVPVSDKCLKFRMRCGERDSNPGTLQYNGFQDRRDRPLRHLPNKCLFLSFVIVAWCSIVFHVCVSVQSGAVVGQELASFFGRYVAFFHG